MQSQFSTNKAWPNRAGLQTTQEGCMLRFQGAAYYTLAAGLTCLWVACKDRLLQVAHGNVVHIVPPALEPLLLKLHHLLGQRHVALMHLLPNWHLAPAAFWLHSCQLGHRQLHTAEQLVAPVNGTWMCKRGNHIARLFVQYTAMFKQAST
jgi:hypothetical protein